MPTTRKRRSRGYKGPGLSYEEIDCFIHSQTLIGAFKPAYFWGSMDEARKVYEENKDYILSLRGVLKPRYSDITYYDHGERPWSWFKWDAPEPRRSGETDFQYLQRLDLLEPGELEAYELQQAKKKQDEIDLRNRLKDADNEEENK